MGGVATSDLESLVNVANWSAVMNVARTIFERCQIWDAEKDMALAYRCEALFRMRLYDDLISELGAILPIVEKQLEEKIDEVVVDRVASLRLLLAEVKLLSGQSSDAFEAYADIESWLSELSPEMSTLAQFWSWHVSCHICNAHIRLRNWKSALRLLRSLFLRLEVVDNETSPEEQADIASAQVILLCRIAKLLLQIGAVKAASAQADLASQLMATKPALTVLDRFAFLQTQTLLLQGLLHFSEERFDVALDVFNTVIGTEKVRMASKEGHTERGLRGNWQSSSWRALRLVLWRQLDDAALSSAVNNYAICCLYLKRVGTAILRLEELVATDPIVFFTDPIVFNLCTMYDLCFAPDVATNKKKALQKVAARYHINDSSGSLHWRSFRLN